MSGGCDSAAAKLPILAQQGVMDSIAVETFLQILATGLIVGANYGLMCLGLGIIFGVMRVINFAQGDMVMMGMYFALVTVGWLATGVSTAYFWLLFSAVLGAAVFYVFGAGLHRGLLSKITGSQVADREDAGHSPQLILTLGISLIMQNVALMLFGSTPKSVRTPLSASAWEFGPLWGENIYLFLNQARTVSAVIAVALAIALAIFIKYSPGGRQLRAAANNPVAATYLGVDVTRQHRIAFGIGVAMTAIAGILMSAYQPFHPYTGHDLVVIMYAGVVLGGMGSIGGAFWGGLILGFVQQMSTLFLPIQLQTTAIFVVFLTVLLFRPQGLFGKNVERV